MKQLLTLGLFVFLTIKSFAQTDGITYQAIIISPDVLQLPGIDSQDNILPVKTVAIRFTIFDSGNIEEFKEEQITKTDEFGRINLIIGAVEHDDFEAISWDGTPKDLKVEIDFEGGSSFVDMSREQLTFVPYAYHRNITATGTLDIEGNTFLNGELLVEGPTTLNSTLLVFGGNEANLTGDLTVDGATNLNSTLDVNNKSITNLSGALNVGVASGTDDVDAPTILNGTLNVVGKTTVTDFEATGESAFNELTTNTLEVITSSNLLGDTTMNGTVLIESGEQIKITSTAHTAPINYDTNAPKEQVIGDDPGKDIDNYPLLIDGSTQGIAIKVSQSRRNGNNFVSFWDNTDNMWGRIEGEIPDEFGNNSDYEYDLRAMAYDVYDSELDLAWASIDIAIEAADLISAYTDFRPCLGFGACAVSPGAADIAASVLSVVLVLVKEGFAIDANNRANDNEDKYNDNKNLFKGVTYASGSGDYAEYLLRADLNESMTYGDIVGVNGGQISKNTDRAESMMVVSFKPIVLGNMPQPNRESEYEKVAFMGQVPVKVFGKVNIGDYIVPSGKNNGVGIAVNPSQVTIENIKNIVGVAWGKNTNMVGVNMINVAVGLNNNDNNPIVEKLENQVLEQAVEIIELKKQITEIYSILSKSEEDQTPLTKKALSKTTAVSNSDHYDDRKYEIIDTEKGEVIYWEVTIEDFENGIEMAEAQMRIDGIDFKNNLFWNKLKQDSAFKNKMLGLIKTKMDKQIHYHKEMDKKGKH